MTATLSQPHRFMSMRNPFVRVVLLVTACLCFATLTFHSESLNVRSVILKTAAPAKKAFWHSSQHSLSGSESDEFDGVYDEVPSSLSSSSLLSSTNVSPSMSCDYDMDHLRELRQKYDLQNGFEYMKRYVKIDRQNIKRKSMTKLQQSFMVNKFKTIDVEKSSYKPDACSEPLVLHVSQSPFPATANASDFMFGVSTTYKRFTDHRTSPVNEWTYWLTDNNGHSNGGKLILMLMDATDEELEGAYKQLVGAGIDVDIYHSDSSTEMAVRYLTLVPTLYNHPERPNKKWLVTCDDDTFFPAFHALAERFEEYDYTMPMYIGTLSEDINNIHRHGSQAFGGAGVFLSVPMAKLVTEMHQTCKTEEKIRESDSGWGPQGDILLRKCIYENSEVVLTLNNDLWQIDIFGDPSGFYESGMKPLSLHHYRGGGWHVAHPWHYTKIAHLCGEDCTLQRFRTADNFIISTSFSITHYPKGIDFDLNQVERTFGAAPEDYGWNLDYALGPQRPSLLKTGRKISWDLQESNILPDGSVNQIYVLKHYDWRWTDPYGNPMTAKDGIIELVWIR